MYLEWRCVREAVTPRRAFAVDLESEYAADALDRAVSARVDAGVVFSVWACDFAFLEYEVIAEHGAPGVAAAFDVRKGLIRKATLEAHLAGKKSRVVRPTTVVVSTYNVFHAEDPFFTNFRIPRSSRDRLEEACAEVPADVVGCYVVKASIGAKGADVHFVHTKAQVLDILEEWREMTEWVVQVEIADLLLFDNRRFHLRVYVLCVGRLSVYVHTDFLLLAAASESEKITNTYAARLVDGYDESKCVLRFEDAFPEHTTVRESVAESVSELFSSFENCEDLFDPREDRFEWFGLDFMVNTSHEAVFLETNAGPDFAQSGAACAGVVDEFFAGVLDVLLETHDAHTSKLRRVYAAKWRPPR